MRIELSKKITLKKIEFIGEVDFFEESPYIKFLEKFSTEKELIEELESKELRPSAINNIIDKLKKLGVIEYGDIDKEKLIDGFPEKEYGKYSLEFFENDTRFPFKIENREIKRENSSYGDIKGIKQERYILEKFYKKSKNFSDDKIFQIMRLERDKYRETSFKEIDLRLNFIDNKWEYILENKKFPMEAIDIKDLFLGAWDSKQKALNVSFNWLSDAKSKKDFIWSFSTKDYKINNYGVYQVKFQNIPVIPKTKIDALNWLLYLLKDEIENQNRYISKDEVHWLWNNLLEDKPQLKSFDLKFSFKELLNKFGQGSKYYWLLQSGVDLYPFDMDLTPKSRVIINAENNINLDTDFVEKFNIKIPKELIIVDRWIKTLNQFEGLEKIIKAFDSPKITIITQDIDHGRLRRWEKDKIEEIIKNNHIRRVIKQKNKIVHSRYWIFDNHKFYKTNNSLDIISINEKNVSIKEQTTFDLYDKEDLEPELMLLLREI